MRSTIHETGPFPGQTIARFASSGFVASLVGRWRQYRMLRDAEAVPFAVMKDIGFRAADHANAK